MPPQQKQKMGERRTQKPATNKTFKKKKYPKSKTQNLNRSSKSKPMTKPTEANKGDEQQTSRSQVIPDQRTIDEGETPKPKPCNITNEQKYQKISEITKNKEFFF